MAVELCFNKGTLQLTGAEQSWLATVFPDLNWTWDRRTDCWRIHAQHYERIRETLGRIGPEHIQISDLDERSAQAVASEPLTDSSAVSAAINADLERQLSLLSGLDGEANDAESATTLSGSECRADSYEEREQRLAKTGPAWINRVPRWQEVKWPANRLPKLRAEQSEAVSSWMKERRGCVVMATGTGKTEVAMSIMARLGVSTLVVAPVRDLMYQWERRVRDRLGYECGIIGDSRWDVRPVSVTTYDSACIHMERLGDRFQLLVFDECHHLPGLMRQEAALLSAAPFRLGLTATPERRDGRHEQLDELIGPVVYSLPISKAAGKTLADYRVIRMPIHLSETERARYNRYSKVIRDYVAKQRGQDPLFRWENVFRNSLRDPEARQAVSAFRIKRSIEDRAQGKLRILEDLFRLHVGEPVIVFAGSNEMAREVSRQFLIPCLLSHCGKEERREVLEGLESGDYPAIVANQVLDEGVDLPEVKVAVVIGGSASERQSKQRLGRILRRSRFGDAILYEVVTHDTAEVKRSRTRRRNDAFQRSSDK